MLLTLAFLSSSHGDFTVWAVIGAVGGVYLFYRGFRLLQRKRLILDTPSSRIRSAAMGLVEVNGLAVGPYTMTAPITGRACYYYRTIAWQLKQSGKNKQWQKVAEESLHLPFFLDDNTGRVLVNPQGAELDIHRDFHEEFSGSFFGSNPDVPANVAGFLARHGVNNDHKLKVDEYCIKPKNALFILGTLAQNPGVQIIASPVRTVSNDVSNLKLNLPLSISTMFSPASAVMTVTRSVTTTAFARTPVSDPSAPDVSDSSRPSSLSLSQQGKIAAALTKAGIANPPAWSAAGLSPPGVNVAAVEAAAAAGEAFDPHPPTVMMKGEHDPTFLISWQSQKEIVKSLGWKSAAMIWGGPLLTLISMYALAAHYGWW